MARFGVRALWEWLPVARSFFGVLQSFQMPSRWCKFVETFYTMGRKKIEQQVLHEMSNGDNDDAILRHLLDGSPLTAEQEKLYTRYFDAWRLTTKMSEIDVSKYLMKTYCVTYQTTRNDILKAQNLFGGEKINKEARRISSITFYDRVAAKAEKKGDFMSAIKAREQADKLARLHEKAQGGLDPNEIFGTDGWRIIPTTSTTALQQQKP
jgi:hypothetical protein